jgi:hypothetical protein
MELKKVKDKNGGVDSSLNFLMKLKNGFQSYSFCKIVWKLTKI